MLFQMLEHSERGALLVARSKEVDFHGPVEILATFDQPFFKGRFAIPVTAGFVGPSFKKVPFVFNSLEPRLAQ